MGIKIITGFDLSKSAPLNEKEKVADSTARLALTFPYQGMMVQEADTGAIYEYIGDETTNEAGDWIIRPRWHSVDGVPDNDLGYEDDVAVDITGFSFYRKTGVSTWTKLFDFRGAQIYTSVGTPSDVDGADGDINIEDDGDVYKKAAGTWGSPLFNIRGADGQSDTYATTSATSIDLGTASAPLSITIASGLSYTVGQTVVAASRADNDNNLTGDVVSYSGTTLVLDNLTINGTGTHTDWDVNLSGAPGRVGKAFIHTQPNVTLGYDSGAPVSGVTVYILDIEADAQWTTANPWSAYIQNDFRSGLDQTLTANLTGPMDGNSIAWDGVRWWNNGTWRGPRGGDGLPGDPGRTGDAGPFGPGYNGITLDGTDVSGNKLYHFIGVNGAGSAPIVVPKGDQGGQGIQGIQGIPGVDGDENGIGSYKATYYQDTDPDFGPNNFILSTDNTERFGTAFGNIGAGGIPGYRWAPHIVVHTMVVGNNSSGTSVSRAQIKLYRCNSGGGSRVLLHTVTRRINDGVSTPISLEFTDINADVSNAYYIASVQCTDRNLYIYYVGGIIGGGVQFGRYIFCVPYLV